MTRIERDYMTVVFKMKENMPNPFTTENPFGKVVAAGIGDIMGRENELSEAIEYALDRSDIDWLRGFIEDDPESIAEFQAWQKRYDDLLLTKDPSNEQA